MLEGLHRDAQKIRQRRGLARNRIGIDIDHLAADQQLVRAMDLDPEVEARSSETLDPYADVDLVIVYRRRLILDLRLAHIQIGSMLREPVRIGKPKRAVVLGDADVEIRQVMAVEHDALPVDLGPAHAQPVGKSEFLSRHGGAGSVEAIRIPRHATLTLASLKLPAS